MKVKYTNGDFRMIRWDKVETNLRPEYVQYQATVCGLVATLEIDMKICRASYEWWMKINQGVDIVESYQGTIAAYDKPEWGKLRDAKDTFDELRERCEAFLQLAVLKDFAKSQGFTIDVEKYAVYGELVQKVEFQEKQNANLIAAAPDLYEALKEAAIVLSLPLKWLIIDESPDEAQFMRHHMSRAGEAFDLATRALKKARGEVVE